MSLVQVAQGLTCIGLRLRKSLRKIGDHSQMTTRQYLIMLGVVIALAGVGMMFVDPGLGIVLIVASIFTFGGTAFIVTDER